MSNNSHIERPLPKAELPVLPVVITTLMSIDTDRDDCFDQLTALARLDPSLTIKILQLAATMKTAMGGDTLAKAMMCIGVEELQRLVSAQSTARVFSPMSDAEKGIWLHCIQVALLSESLAHALPELSLDSDRAHLAGLLHDIGRLVFFDRVANAPNEIDASDYDSPESLLMAEADALGRSHVDIGNEVIKAWALPAYVAAVISHHHGQVRSLRTADVEIRKLIELIQFADEISVYQMRGYDLDSTDFEDLYHWYMAEKSVYLKDTTLALPRLSALLDDIFKTASKVFLDLKIGPPPG